MASIAAGPVSDFTGPMGSPMPVELWGCVLGKVDFTAPIGDVLIAAVETYRREAPHYWTTLHPSNYPDPSTRAEGAIEEGLVQRLGR